MARSCGAWRVAAALCTLGAALTSAPPTPAQGDAAQGDAAQGDALARAELAALEHFETTTSPVVRALGTIRGMTVGPIENALFRERGYGSAAYDDGLVEVQRFGGTWVSITPFGRVWDLQSTGIDWCFESPASVQRREIVRAIRMAHARGLRVMLVPHLWVERGGWRGEMAPHGEEAWQRWKDSYAAFALRWARVAQEEHVDLFSLGVELRSWVTSTHATGFGEFIARVRDVYRGPLTYAANWDDAKDTIVWGDLDVIGINAFFPLTKDRAAGVDELRTGAEEAAVSIAELASGWGKPVLFTEIGYTTRTGAAVDPWEWPDGMQGVKLDERAQAEAYFALISAFVDRPWFLGFFVWRLYADPRDLSQEAEWGFSPRGKWAELVVRDAFAAHFAMDGLRAPWTVFTERATRIGL